MRDVGEVTNERRKGRIQSLKSNISEGTGGKKYGRRLLEWDERRLRDERGTEMGTTTRRDHLCVDTVKVN